jgi:hypothetical protein
MFRYLLLIGFLFSGVSLVQAHDDHSFDAGKHEHDTKFYGTEKTNPGRQPIPAVTILNPQTAKGYAYATCPYHTEYRRKNNYQCKNSDERLAAQKVCDANGYGKMIAYKKRALPLETERDEQAQNTLRHLIHPENSKLAFDGNPATNGGHYFYNVTCFRDAKKDEETVAIGGSNSSGAGGGGNSNGGSNTNNNGNSGGSGSNGANNVGNNSSSDGDKSCEGVTYTNPLSPYSTQDKNVGIAVCDTNFDDKNNGPSCSKATAKLFCWSKGHPVSDVCVKETAEPGLVWLMGTPVGAGFCDNCRRYAEITCITP